jgi:hypothetical protein
MQEHGYRIIPVNPHETEVLGEKAYPSLDAVPEPTEVVVIFRRPQFVPDIVDAAVRKGAEVIWMQEGVALYRSAGQRVGLRNRVQLVEALLEEGRLDEGLEAIEGDLAHVLATGEGALASEVYRLKGEALAHRSPGDPQSLLLLEQALAIASAQGADLLALRAAMSLARHQGNGGGPPPALGAVKEILARFREGLELSELRAARALLDGPRT